MFERKKPSGKLLSLPIDQIHPSPFQARKSFDEQELTALAQSIRENGLLQPVTVRKAAEGYELVAGERRLRACQLAKMTTITGDSFPKIVVRKDIGKRWYDDNGILNINVIDFLLDKELI